MDCNLSSSFTSTLTFLHALFVEIAAIRLWAILIIVKHACEDPEIVSGDDMDLAAEPLYF